MLAARYANSVQRLSELLGWGYAVWLRGAGDPDGADMRTVFRLALRQTEGLIGSILHLLGLELAVPDHTTLSRRAARLRVPRPRAGTGPLQLLVDSTGLAWAGPANGWSRSMARRPRRSWRKLHLGVDAGTGGSAVAS